MTCDCIHCCRARLGLPPQPDWDTPPAPSIAATMLSINFNLNCLLIMLELKRIERERARWW